MLLFVSRRQEPCAVALFRRQTYAPRSGLRAKSRLVGVDPGGGALQDTMTASYGILSNGIPSNGIPSNGIPNGTSSQGHHPIENMTASHGQVQRIG